MHSFDPRGAAAHVTLRGRVVELLRERGDGCGGGGSYRANTVQGTSPCPAQFRTGRGRVRTPRPPVSSPDDAVPLGLKPQALAFHSAGVLGVQLSPGLERPPIRSAARLAFCGGFLRGLRGDRGEDPRGDGARKTGTVRVRQSGPMSLIVVRRLRRTLRMSASTCSGAGMAKVPLPHRSINFPDSTSTRSKLLLLASFSGQGVRDLIIGASRGPSASSRGRARESRSILEFVSRECAAPPTDCGPDGRPRHSPLSRATPRPDGRVPRSTACAPRTLRRRARCRRRTPRPYRAGNSASNSSRQTSCAPSEKPPWPS